MESRPVTAPSMKKGDFSLIQKQLSTQCQQTQVVHAEIITAVTTFRNAIACCVDASENLSQSIGKLSMVAMTSGQLLSELKIGGSDGDVEKRRRQLNNATQQLMRFQTLFSTEHRALASSAALDVEAPMLLSLNAHRDAMQVRIHRFISLKQFQIFLCMHDTDTHRIGNPSCKRR
jgi:hypothetical protein